MPTELEAQNGALITQSTPIKITGCKRLTNQQKLAKALNACHKKKNKHNRTACQHAARIRYAVSHLKRNAKARS